MSVALAALSAIELGRTLTLHAQVAGAAALMASQGLRRLQASLPMKMQKHRVQEALLHLHAAHHMSCVHHHKATVN